MDIENFTGKGPEFLPEEFLVGELEGWGVLESVTGSLQSRFVITANGVWRPRLKTVEFSETWTLDNGHVDTLNWRITKIDDGQYTGSKDRILGEAKGEQAGCAFHWTYSRDTPQKGGSSHNLNFNDWFFRIDEKVTIVRGSAGKLGLPFAFAHVTYRKLD
jgi:hypothetical protein